MSAVRSNLDTVRCVLDAALRAVDPAEAVRRQVGRQGDILLVAGRQYDLKRYHHVYLVGGGKASIPMATALSQILEGRVTAGHINTRRTGPLPAASSANDVASLLPGSPITVTEAGHPLPDQRGEAGVARMAELLRVATAEDLVLFVISGGGSALMTWPMPGISLEDKREVTQQLLSSGATINELNAVRKHISRCKGGQLAQLAYPAEVITLILSDVVGSPLDVIASGPTVPDASTYDQALRVLAGHGLLERAPRAVVELLEGGAAGLLPETPKAGDPIFERTFNVLVGDNRAAARAAAVEADRLGFHTMLLSTSVEGEAREVGKVFAALAREIEETGGPVAPPACLIAGGETTVTVRGQGTGGRNQEMALAAALKIAGLEHTLIACCATDGADGPTEATGAWVDGATVHRALEMGFDAGAFLADNDSHTFFRRVGGLIVTGPTNTNVNDLTFVFVA
jgi:glycerate 2-kinase